MFMAPLGMMLVRREYKEFYNMNFIICVSRHSVMILSLNLLIKVMHAILK